MAEQLELADAPASIEARARSYFERMRETHGPSVRLILVLDRRPLELRGPAHLLFAVGPASPWHSMLPDEQIVRLYTPEQKAAELEHERQVFTLALQDPVNWERPFRR